MNGTRSPAGAAAPSRSHTATMTRRYTKAPITAVTIAITIDVSAKAISAWPKTTPPCRQRRSENAMRRIAPGCQSVASAGGS